MGLIKPLCDSLRDNLRLLNIYLPSICLKRNYFFYNRLWLVMTHHYLQLF